MRKDVNEREQEFMLTVFQLRSSANLQGRNWRGRRSLRNEIGDICDTAKMVCKDLKRRRARRTTKIVMTLRKDVNGHETEDTLNFIIPVFFIVSFTLWAVAHLTTSLASWALDMAMP